MFLVLPDVFGQIGGFVGELPLLAGQSFRIVAAGGAALDVFLLLDEAVDQFEVLAKPRFFTGDMLCAILAQQQLHQGPQVLIDLRLVLQCPGELVLAQQLHETVESHGDELVLALGHGLLQQCGTARIGRRAQFRHAEQHVLKMFVPLGDALFLRGERVGGAGLRRSCRAPRRGGPAGAQPAAVPTQGWSPRRPEQVPRKIAGSLPCLTP